VSTEEAAKIMGEVHARIPTVTMHDRQTDQVKAAKPDLQSAPSSEHRQRLREMGLSQSTEATARL
jgi:hypothetical protein